MKKKLMLLLALATIGCSAFGFASCDLLEKLPFFGDKVVDEQPGDDEYVVTYADGDTILNTVTVKDGSNPERPANPEKTGYNFKGWSYDPDGVNMCEFDKALNKNSTLYAQWQLATYKVSYVYDGVELYWDETEYFTVPEKPEDPVDEKNNFYFVGWYTEETFENKYRFIEPLEGDTTLYAKFTGAEQIATADDLKKIAEVPTASYILTADINFKNKEWTPIENFTGEIDGNDHTISYFVINDTSGHVGFVKTNNGTIKDLTLDNFVINANTSAILTAGALVGTNNGTVSNCSIVNTKDPAKNNIVYKTDVYTRGSGDGFFGGLVGKNNGTIADCYTEGNMRAWIRSRVADGGHWSDSQYFTYNAYISPLVGANYGTVKGSNSVMKIDAEGYAHQWYDGDRTNYSTANLYVGGVVAHNDRMLTECNYNGEIFVKGEAGSNHTRAVRIGGVVYNNTANGTITKCFADGKVTDETANFDVAGAAGFCYTNSGTIENCYTNFDIETNSVGGEYYGGFVGVNYHAVANCYTATNITTKGQCAIGGFVGVLADQGTIGASFCLGNISCTNENESQVDAFNGGTRDGGTNFCYYSKEMLIEVNKAKKDTVEEDIAIQEKTFDDLMTVATLVEEDGGMFWDTNVWNIDGFNPPTLK